MRNSAIATLILSLILAGCAVPAATRDDEGTPPIASAADVDLHDYVLNITMPEGQPTMLVTLDVSPDMWVRPFIGAPTPLGYRNTPATQQPTYWVLCPWVASEGVADGALTVTFAFWLDAERLVPAGALAYANDDEGGGRCAGSVFYDTRVMSIATNEPFAGSLALLVTMENGVTTFPRPANEPPSAPVRLSVGIATKPCDRDFGSYYCPPDEAVAVEPLLRGGMPLDAYHTDSTPCNGCGYQIDDRRDLGAGNVHVTRTGEVTQGLTFVYASYGTNAVVAQLTTDGEVTNLSCSDVAGNSWLHFLASHNTPAELQLDFDIRGIRPAGSFDVDMIEIPIDLRVTGFTLEPYAVAYSGWQSAVSETSMRLCQ